MQCMFSHKSIFSRHDNNLESSICLLHYQLINHPFNHHVTLLINHPLNHPVTLSITQSSTQSSCYTINHPLTQSITHWIILLPYQLLHHPLNHPVTLSNIQLPTQSSCYTISHSTIPQSSTQSPCHTIIHSIIYSIILLHYQSSLNHTLNHPVTL